MITKGYSYPKTNQLFGMIIIPQTKGVTLIHQSEFDGHGYKLEGIIGYAVDFLGLSQKRNSNNFVIIRNFIKLRTLLAIENATSDKVDD